MEGRTRLLLLVLGMSIFNACQSQTTKTIGNLTLVCPPGWTFYGTSCYLKVSTVMEWEEAKEQCIREQGMPLEIQDEVENKALADMAADWDMFWVGEKINDSFEGYWDVNEPPASVKEGDCAAVQKNGRWKVVPCQSRLPFFCKNPSCLEGSFDCGRGNCLNNKWKCDGINDCDNNRDEMDCSSKCTFRETGASGSINYFSGYANNTYCMWTIISPPGTQIGVTFRSVRLEDKVDLLEVRVGGQTIQDTRVLETLTGSLDNKVIYSTNNMMLLRLTSDASVTGNGFNLTWSSSTSVLSMDVRPMTAGSSWTDLTSPFFPSTPPSGFRLEWLVSSSDNTIVTLMVDEVDLAPDWMLMVYNGERYDDTLLMASRRDDLSSPAIYFSTASKIRIILKGKDTSGGGRGIKLRVKNGCNVEIQAASGIVSSPGFSRKRYPTSVTCSWKIQAPSDANRNLMVKFLYLVLETVGKDLIEIYNGSDASAGVLHMGSGYTGDLTSSLPSVNGGNTLYIRFKSSLIQDKGGFQFEFSIDCPSIPDSSNMVKSTPATSYLSSVKVNCTTGYSFKQEEYYQKDTVSFLCERGGKWDKTRYPTCQAFCDRGVGYDAAATTCTVCPEGSYKDTRGNTACKPCPKNYTTSGTNATDSADCNILNCEPGFFAHNTETCTPCPKGYYKASVGTENCTKCDADKTTQAEASTNQSACSLAVCPAGQYRSADNTCQRCAVGEYQPASGQTNCTKCDTGFTTKVTGSNMATDCLVVCSAGRYRSSRTVCSVCDVGTYQPNTGTESCINCTTGFITSNNASTAESDCYRLCPAGQYRPASDRRACNECMRGTYQPSSGKTRCITCTPPGYTTLQTASTKEDDCMPSCGAGKYLNVTSRSCIPCPLGTFLPTAGTTTQCRMCPTGRTTTGTGATQEANCDLVDCEPGYFRKENQGCQACGKGFYQPSRGQTSCIKCDVNTTTFLSVTTATDKAQCIADCAEGTGYNRLTKACDSCPIGQIRKPNISDYCYFCPTGQTTAFAGSKTCLDFQATTRAPVFRTVRVRMSFIVVACENAILIHNTITVQIRFLIRIRARVFPGLCQGSSCGNIAISIIVPCGGTRRKRQTGGTVTAEVTASNLPEQIPNTDNTISRSPESLLVQALADNAAATPALDPAGITVGTITPQGSSTSCTPGSVMRSGSCEPCPVGTRHDISADACQDCDIGQYQDQTGQTSCMTCAGMLSTSAKKSTNVSFCVSKCKLDTGYCKNSGICRDGSAGSVSCDCSEYYTGDTCTVRRSFCAAGQQVNGTQCEPCPRGTWNDGSSQMRFLPCEACSDANYTTPTAGANHSSQCTLRNCSPGYRIVSGSNCEACGYGQFQPLPAKSSCIDCGSELNTSTIASTSQKDCTISCPPGKEDRGKQCFPCPNDTFKDRGGFGSCEQCLGSVTSDSNRTNCNVMFCDRGVGYDAAAKTCTVCPQGLYKDTRGNTACKPCPKNYTTAGTSATDSADCDKLNCVEGFFAHKTNTCMPCPKGYYKDSIGTENCTKCDANKTTQTEASINLGACNLKVCPAGEYRSEANTCQKCAVGEYQPNSGMTECTKCDTGNTTLSTGSSKASDCLNSCGAGTYLNVTSRSCISCPLGTFLPNNTGTTQECVQCPTGMTTRDVGATQQDNCDLVDCQPGNYRKEGKGCQACGKGFYQPNSGRTSCIKCDDGKTTLLSVTNATTKAQCIGVCPKGKEYNLRTKKCDPCDVGQIRKPSVSDFCYFCPSGQTTATKGSETCLNFPASGTTPAPVQVTVKLKMIFIVVDCVHKDFIEDTIIKQIEVLLLNLDNEFPDLCQDSSCGNIAVSILVPCGGTRRKRQTGGKVTAEISASNLPEELPNMKNTVSRSPESVMVQALSDNATVATALTAAGITFESLTQPTVSCGSGLVKTLENCEPCPAGTRHNTATDACQDCDIGQYQDQTGKTSCKACLGVRSTNTTRSTNISDCVSRCKLETGYCKNRGICRDSTDGSVSCDCGEYYTGDTCTVRRSLESDLSWVIVGVCIGLFVLLITILGGGCLWHKRSRGSARNDKHVIVDESSTHHDYMRSPFAAHQGYIQYPNPEYNEAYDFYSADERYLDQQNGVLREVY